MGSNPHKPNRTAGSKQDLGSIDAISYNDAAGSKKVILIDPPIKAAVSAAENIGPGKYVKITGTSYTLDLIDKAYDTGKTYQYGDVVTDSGFVWLATDRESITGTFDTQKWRKVAAKSIGPITVTAGTTVTTGRWHNTVTVAGFLIDDESDISYKSVRD